MQKGKASADAGKINCVEVPLAAKAAGQVGVSLGAGRKFIADRAQKPEIPLAVLTGNPELPDQIVDRNIIAQFVKRFLTEFLFHRCLLHGKMVPMEGIIAYIGGPAVSKSGKMTRIQA